MKKIESISPFLITPSEFNTILSKQPTEEIIYIDWIHVKKDGTAIEKDKFIEAEYDMFDESAQRCCTLKDNFYLLDEYYCYAYEQEENPSFPEWWKYWIDELDKEGNSSFHGTSLVSSSFVDNLFQYKYSRKVKELDLLMLIDYNQLRYVNVAFPVPTIRTVDEMTKDQLGIEEVNSDIFKLTKKLIEGYVEDFSIPYPYQIDRNSLPTLQDIVFHGCKTHDQVAQEEFTYTYNTGDITIKANVKKMNSKTVLILFKNVNEIEGDKYLTWTSSMVPQCLVCISKVWNESTYKKIER